MNRGARFGQFEVLRGLERNDTDELLLARAHGPGGFHRTVVLKRYFAQFESETEPVKRLAREALAYSLLTHPAIVRLYDFLLIDGQPVLVLEHVQGLSLARLLRTLRARRMRVPDAVALYVAHCMFSALAAAHRARNPETGEFAPVIHRDVNPSNVLLTRSGDVKLANFGLAKVAGSEELSRPGTSQGTYGYMAPEQVFGDAVSVRTDVYLAALVLWEMLTGRRAFDVDSMPELEILQAMATPRLPALVQLRHDLSPRLIDAVGASLSADPDARSVSATEMAALIASLVDLRDAREACATIVAVAHDDATRERPAEAPPLLFDDDKTGLFDITPDSGVQAVHAPRAETIATPGGWQAPATEGLPSLQPVAASLPPRAKRRSGVALAATVVLGLTLAAFGAPSVVQRAQRAASGAAPALGSSAIAASSSSAPANASAASARPESPHTGVLRIPRRAAQDRVVVDGSVVGQGGGEIEVRCGRRTVRVGRQGPERTVNVPCGGVVTVE